MQRASAERLHGRCRFARRQQPLDLAQPAAKRGVQLRPRGTSAATAATASAAASAAAGDADVSGWIGNRGDRNLPAATAAAATASRRRTRWNKLTSDVRRGVPAEQIRRPMNPGGASSAGIYCDAWSSLVASSCIGSWDTSIEPFIDPSISRMRMKQRP